MAKMGRPKSDDPKQHQVTVRLSDAQMARLIAYCEKFRLNKAQVFMNGFEELERQAKEAEQNE